MTKLRAYRFLSLLSKLLYTEHNRDPAGLILITCGVFLSPEGYHEDRNRYG